jgi:hypothetical protein
MHHATGAAITADIVPVAMRVDVSEMVKQKSSRATENITILSESMGSVKLSNVLEGKKRRTTTLAMPTED